MTLHRRQVLTALGTTGVATLAGCSSLGGNALSEHTTKLAAVGGDEDDQFGGSVAVAADGTTALVGADGDEDPNGDYAGAAYVFERSGGSWSSLMSILTGTQQAKLTPADGHDGDHFGRSVAMAGDGTTALIGAPGDEDPNGEDAGSAYVFERSDDSWTQQANLTAADGDSLDDFGSSVAVAADGGTAVVGAPDDEDPNGDEAGSVYVFERAGDSWTQQAKLADTDGDSHDSFGGSVAMAADRGTAVVGAPDDETLMGDFAGSAYVFERSGGTWTQQANLTAADGDPLDHFGRSVAVAADGTTAIVGAERDEDPNGYEAGSAYVFERSGGTWTQLSKLMAAAGDPGDHFGSSVAVAADSTTALVGADLDDDPNGSQAGAVYVFERAGDSWTQQAKLADTDGDEEDEFGKEVAMAAGGTTALVGANDAESPNGEHAGSAYVFERANGTWTQQANLVPADGDEDDGFGASVAVAADGTTAVVGANWDDDPNGKRAGAAYVFDRADGTWTQQAKLAATNGDSVDIFGDEVAMAADGTTALVGAWNDEDPNGDNAGSAYVFERAAPGPSRRNSRPLTETRTIGSARQYRWRLTAPPPL